MKKDKWVISQIWRDILFLNYKVDKNFLLKHIPDCLELDTFQGQAFASVVPFRMEGIRFPFTPRLPFSRMWELNLRTYVSYEGVPGIYFFTLDTDHVLAQWIAETFFHLPYRVVPLRGFVDSSRYLFEAKDTLKLEAALTPVPLVTSAYHEWMVERYCLYTFQNNSRGQNLWRGEVIHEPWPLCYAKLQQLQETFCENLLPGLNGELDSVFFAKTLPVYFKPFTKLT